MSGNRIETSEQDRNMSSTRPADAHSSGSRQATAAGTHSLGVRAAWGGAILLASIALGVVVGCGNQTSDTGSAAANSQPVVAEKTSNTPAPIVAASAPQPVTEPLSADSLPPEIVASARDSVVVPGMVVEILAQGSPDVSGVMLKDDLGRLQALTYDTDAKAWRTYYRVPMKFHGERMSLSVTASNSHNRWRRVWLFLELKPGEDDISPE